MGGYIAFPGWVLVDGLVRGKVEELWYWLGRYGWPREEFRRLTEDVLRLLDRVFELEYGYPPEGDDLLPEFRVDPVEHLYYSLWRIALVLKRLAEIGEMSMLPFSIYY